MQGFNKLFTLVLTITLLFLLAGCGSEEKKQESVSETVTQSTGNKLQIGILDNYAPFSYQENGELKGINYELVKEAFKRMNVEVEFKVLPWQRQLMMVKNGEIDGVMDAAFNEERATFANFPKEATSLDIVCFYVLPDSALTWNGKMESLKDKKIASMRGYAFGDDFSKAQKENIIILDESDSFASNYEKLTKKRVDLMVDYKTICEYEMKKLGKSMNTIKMLEPAILKDFKQFLIFSKKSSKADQTLIEKFSSTLQEIRTDGTYQKIYDRYTK